jgi:hypothetical protein
LPPTGLEGLRFWPAWAPNTPHLRFQRRLERVTHHLNMIHIAPSQLSSAASLWIAAGVDIKTVSAWLGHSPAKLTLDV